MISTLSTVVLLIGFLAVLYGVLARRDRPIGHVGWCRSCRHPVHEQASLCSECGADLTARAAIRRTRLRVRRGLVVFGVLACLIGLGGVSARLVSEQYGFDWNTIKPVWLLRLEGRQGTDVDSERVRAELLRRYHSMELTDAQATTCAEEALARFFTNSGWGSNADAELVELGWTDEALTDESMQAYYESDWDLYCTLLVRSRVHVGQALPYSLRMTERGVTRSPSSQSIRMAPTRILDVDGVEIAKAAGGSSTHGGWSIAGIASMFSSQLDVKLPEGRHEIGIEVAFTLLWNDRERCAWHHVFPVTVTVVPRDEPLVGMVADESLRPIIRDAILLDFEHQTVATSDSTRSRHYDHYGYVGIRAVPVPVAFRILMRREGSDEETMIGTLVRPQDSEVTIAGGFLVRRPLASLLPVGTESIDIILRPDAAAANRSNTTIMEIWDGVIVFEDVPFSRRPLDESEEP